MHCFVIIVRKTAVLLVDDGVCDNIYLDDMSFCDICLDNTHSYAANEM